MKPTRPKFKHGDMIQVGSTPSEVYQVTNVQTNTNAQGNFYELETPTGEKSVKPTKDIDPYLKRNATEFKRQYAAANAPPEDPDFDKDGYPTADFFRRCDENEEGK